MLAVRHRDDQHLSSTGDVEGATIGPLDRLVRGTSARRTQRDD
jgi:hypothetical protein